MSRPRYATLPFTLSRSRDVIGGMSMESTTETVHGILRLEGDHLVLQWRVYRQTEHLGTEFRTDEEFEAIREVTVPLASVAGASVSRSRWWPWARPRIHLTAADMLAFEAVTGEEGLRLSHPAELTLRVRRGDRIAALEFAAELELALAELDRSQTRRFERPERPTLPERGAERDPES